MKRISLIAAMFLLTTVSTMAIDLTFTAPVNFTPGSGLADAAAAQQDILDRFHEANPDITINYELISPGPDGLQTILTTGTAGRLPDFGIVDSQWVARLVESDLLQPLNQYWSEEDRADLLPGFVDAMTFDDNVYAFWFHTGFRSLFFDQRALDALGVAVPTNWDEFIALSEVAKAANQSLVMLPGGTSEVTILHLLSIFWGFGGELVDDAGAPIFADGANREALVKTYQYYKDLVDAGAMPSDVSIMDEGATRPFFYTGESLFSGQSSSGVTQMYVDRPDLQGNLGVLNYPMPEGLTAVPVAIGFTWAIYTDDPERQAAAWKFIEFLNNTENLGRLNEIYGQLPVRKSIWAESEFFAEDPLMAQFGAIVDAGETRSRPSVPIYPAISNAVSAQVAGVLSGSQTPEQAADAAKALVDQEYSRLATR